MFSKIHTTPTPESTPVLPNNEDYEWIKKNPKFLTFNKKPKNPKIQVTILNFLNQKKKKKKQNIKPFTTKPKKKKRK